MQVKIRKPETILNLGCGVPRRLEESYPDARVINVDIDPAVDPDLVCDVRHLPFADGGIDWAYANHILEHLPRLEVLPTVREWARVLAEEGIVRVIVPDLEDAAKQITNGRLDHWILAIVYGGQFNEFQYHKVGFTQLILRGTLVEAGLEVIDEGKEDFLIGGTLPNGKPARIVAQQIYAVGRKR